MIEAVSAGAIIYNDKPGKREYLLLKSRAGDWEFPKGGVEGNEELQQTAIREVKEESGLSNFKLLDGFREEYHYFFQASGSTIHKTVHLFVAKSFDSKTKHFSTSFRINLRLLVTSRKCRPNKMLATI